MTPMVLLRRGLRSTRAAAIPLKQRLNLVVKRPWWFCMATHDPSTRWLMAVKPRVAIAGNVEAGASQ